MGGMVRIDWSENNVIRISIRSNKVPTVNRAPSWGKEMANWGHLWCEFWIRRGVWCEGCIGEYDAKGAKYALLSLDNHSRTSTMLILNRHSNFLYRYSVFLYRCSGFLFSNWSSSGSNGLGSSPKLASDPVQSEPDSSSSSSKSSSPTRSLTSMRLAGLDCN
jgi:hypothetical protein